MTEPTDPYGFSINLDATDRPPPKVDARRFMAPPFRAHPINAEAALVYVEGVYPPKQLNLQLVQILSLCSSFQTLDAHNRTIRQTLRWPKEQAPAVQEALDHLVGLDLLIGEDEFIDALISEDRHPPRPAAIASCFIRTADRSASLARLLASLKTAGTESHPQIWVLDDSKEPDERTANAAAVETLAARWPSACHHIDRERRRHIITAIAEQSGCEVDRLMGVIEGDDQDPSPTYGASLNTALLLAAGQRFCIIDDDATLDAFVMEDTHPSIHIQPKRMLRTRFIDPDQSEASQFPKQALNPVAAHDQWLGLSLAGIVSRTHQQHPELMSELDPQLLHLIHGDSKIRLTTNGTLGDPGTSSMTWLFSQPATDLNALCHQDPKRQDRLFARRFARSSLGIQLTSDFSLMTTTLTGVDNRELLLPTVSKGRNEDLLFAVLMRFLYPDTLTLNLPFMLPHRPDEPRRWTVDDLAPAESVDRQYNHMMIVSDLIEDLDLPPGGHRQRLTFLEAWLRHLAQLDRPAMGSLLVKYITELQAEQVKAMNDSAQALDAPPWLQALYAQAIAQVLAQDDQAADNLPKLGDAIQKFAAEYADGMRHWITAWQWCCQHDATTLIE